MTPLSQQHNAGHHLTAICQTCQHACDLDTADLIARGHGDTPIDRLPLVCAACGGRRVAVVVGGRMAWEF